MVHLANVTKTVVTQNVQLGRILCSEENEDKYYVVAAMNAVFTHATATYSTTHLLKVVARLEAIGG